MREAVKLLERRTKACEKIDKALAHKSRIEVINIITSWLTIDELEKLAEFQNK